MSGLPAAWTAQDLHDEDEDEEIEFELDVARDACVFAIDVSGHMLDEQPSGGNSLLSALKAILILMKKKIISSPKDMLGIVLFNTDVEKGVSANEKYENTYILQDVAEMEATMVQGLKEIINAEEDPAAFRNLFRSAAHQAANQIGHTLHTCNQLLRSRAYRIASKRIYLVTDVEDPYPVANDTDNHQRRATAQTYAKDCAEMQFNILPFFVVHDERTFDVEIFFKDFLLHHLELDAEEAEKYVIREVGSAKKGWDHFLSSTSRKPPPKRSAFSIPFIIGDNLEISVNGYNLISEAKKSLPIKVDLQGAIPREIEPQTTYHDADAGELLDPQKHIKLYFSMGSKDESIPEKKIVFEEEEREELRTVGQQPGLRLLGFLDPESIPVEHFCRHPLFIYPTDKVYLGSTRLFASLLHVMLEKQRAGLGLLVSRKNSTPQHVLILPQREQRDEEDVQTEPPGMHLIQLAYADDIRAAPDSIVKMGTLPASRTVDPEAKRPDIDLCKQIISKLRYKNGYDPTSYDNPALHYHYACLESIALQEPQPEATDQTLPKYINIKKRTGEMIKELRELVDANPESSFTTGKRAKTADGKVVTSKLKRIPDSEAVAAPDQDRIVKLAQADQLHQLKKDEMLAYLTSANVLHKKASNKTVLTEVIEAHLKDSGLV